MASVEMLSIAEKIQSFNHSNEELHVLAVDDSNIDRKVIERLLKISSCKVTAVDSGKRALQLLGLDLDYNKRLSSSAAADNVGGLKVNMIITDYSMPEMTGYELLKKIKESSTFKEIPVVIMSSENVLPRINRCLEEGAEDFLVKPIQLSDVKRLKKNHFTREDHHHQIMADRKNELNGSGFSFSNKRKLNDSSIDLIDIPSISSSSSTSSLLESPARRFKPNSDEILSLI